MTTYYNVIEYLDYRKEVTVNVVGLYATYDLALNKITEYVTCDTLLIQERELRWHNRCVRMKNNDAIVYRICQVNPEYSGDSDDDNVKYLIESPYAYAIVPVRGT